MANKFLYEYFICTTVDNHHIAESLRAELSECGKTCCMKFAGQSELPLWRYIEQAGSIVTVLNEYSISDTEIEKVLSTGMYSGKPLHAVTISGFRATPRFEGYLSHAVVHDFVADAKGLALQILQSAGDEQPLSAAPSQSMAEGLFNSLGYIGRESQRRDAGAKPKPQMRPQDVQHLYQQALNMLAYDKKEAMKRMLECARAGHVPAMLVIAAEYEKKEGTSAHQKARQFYEAAYRTDSVEGAYQFALFLARRDEMAEAEEVMLAAVKNGKHHGAAQELLVWYGAGGPLENEKRAAFFQDYLISAGDTNAMISRARKLLCGGQTHEAEALQLLERANRTDANAAMEIADYFIANRNEPRAAAYLFDAADRGNHRAQYLLGVWYAEGRAGCRQNYAEAARWLGRAAAYIPEATELLRQPQFKNFAK